MYLRRMELQGFKTFAAKTVLEFLTESGGRRGLTAVVGPNGSGKSNVADAIRWVMGEQSLKLLRGKKSEDVIFSGSDKKARAGFAEASMTLVNDDHPDIDLPEIVVTRRVFRDGQSEYQINKQSVRLTDVVLLLAQAGMGQRTYSVIGQGMVDAILSATPTERKEFFDEAAGLKPFQLKRQSSMNKLEATKDNLKQAELLLREIGPRLTSLERQAKRLQERDSLTEELRELEKSYYGRSWNELREKLRAASARVQAAEQDRDQRAEHATRVEAELATLEKATPPSEGFREIRKELDRYAAERAELRERKLRFQAERDVAQARAETSWSPLSLSKIISSVEDILKTLGRLGKLIKEKSLDAKSIEALVKEATESHEDLLSKLQRPAPEPVAPKKDVGKEEEFAKLAGEIAQCEERIAGAEKRLEEWNSGEEKKRSHIFALQHNLTSLRNDATAASSRVSEASVELARLETRRDAFFQELRAYAPKLETDLEAIADAVGAGLSRPDAKASSVQDDLETAGRRLTKLRSQIEWIGGIDPEVLTEYQETKKRFEDLATQVKDLQDAMVSLETILKELDTTIRERSETSFHLLDREFGLAFKKLFGGGEASLIEIPPEPETDEEGNIIAPVDPDAPAAGVEIHATPPGKRMKSVSLLSGGERALTSIALICAIMATNPSPFVVLDEVDAALDEANSQKFADIVHTLAERTQFIVITHNRATMQQAHVLYGVTMGDDGVSQLLSVKIDDVVGKAVRG